MPQNRRKPVPSGRTQLHPPAPAHLRSNQPARAPQMQYRQQPQHHGVHHGPPPQRNSNHSNHQVAQLQGQQNVQRGQIARHGAQLSHHTQALQNQSAAQHRQNAALRQQSATQQKQFAKQSAAMQKQFAKQSAATQHQNERLGHELQTMKHKQQQGYKQKGLAGAAAGTAVGAGGTILYHGISEERIHVQIEREQSNVSDDGDEYEHSDGEDWPEEDNFEYPNPYVEDQYNNEGYPDNGDPAPYDYDQTPVGPTQERSESGGGNGDDDDCCGSCCFGCCDDDDGDDSSCCC